jgi:3-deoxy-D-manno-octulosonic acid (KDO) 8-phosphate synthase
VQKEIAIGNVTIGRRPFVFIGGLLLHQGRDISSEYCRVIARVTAGLGGLSLQVHLRQVEQTSISGFRGPGLDECLANCRN